MEKRIDFRDQIARNNLKSFALILIIFLVFVGLGYVISKAFNPGYFFIIMIASIIISLLYIWVGYYNSAKIAVASVGAKKASVHEYKQYHSIVEGLTIASGLPKPELYVMNSPQINAFASGRNPQHSVVCVTTGALEKLDKKELEGVLAHELSHVGNHDIRYMTIATVLVGMIAIASELFLRTMWYGDSDNKHPFLIVFGLVLAILAPIVVQLVQLAISRRREYNADASAVKFTRYPNGLIGALKKIKAENYVEKRVSKAIAPLFFSNPLKGMFSTHPDISKRIEILQRM